MTSYSYLSDPTPNGTSISVGGLNNAGNFVGFTGNYQTDAQGFLYANGSFNGLTYPGASSTIPSDVNDSGQVVGSYRIAGDSVTSHGFTYDGTTFKTLDVPGARFTEIAGINNTGTIVGDSIGADDTFTGFAYSKGQFTSLKVPGATGTFPTGVNDQGQVVGSYDKPNSSGDTNSNGFIFANGSYQTISYPGATDTSLSGISNSGRIIGTAFTQTTDSRGFVTTTNLKSFTYQNGVFEDVSPPAGAAQNVPPNLTGINDHDQILEAASDAQSGRTRVYTATPLCFVAGTLIRTARGDVPVEMLAVGDLAETASGHLRPIRWLGCRTLACTAETAPVRVRAGAFGADLPARDLFLSPGHPVLVGNHLVPVMCLVNGLSIARITAGPVSYWHVELDAHDLLLAEGLPAESYFDMGSRTWFDAGSDAPLADPDFVPAGRHGRCRPVALDGPVVEAERRRLDDVFAMQQAAHCGWPSADLAELCW